MTRAPRLSVLHLLVVAAIGLVAAVAFSACTPEMQAELKTYAGINAIRAQRGLPPLAPDAQLTEVARVRSRDMAARGYFSHTPPDGCDYICIMNSRGIRYAWAGENIAWNTWDWSMTSDVAVDMWKNSPPHLENILNCHYTRMGTGVARASDGKIYFTMIFEGNGAC